MKTSLSINFIDTATGRKGQRSITDVNPNATSAEIKTFAQKLISFTTNTYAETTRIQTINVDTEQIPTTTKEG